MNWQQDTVTGAIVSDKRGARYESLKLIAPKQAKTSSDKRTDTIVHDTSYTVEQASKLTGVSRAKVLRIRAAEGLLN